MENEYLESKFFSIDPKGNILYDFMTEKVSERHFFCIDPCRIEWCQLFPVEKEKNNFQRFYIKFIIS